MKEIRHSVVAFKAAVGVSRLTFLVNLIAWITFCCMTAAPAGVGAQTAKPSWQAEWDKTIELAKKEGKVVVSMPASTELRAGIERLFEKRYGIDVEPVVGRASTVVR